METKMPERFLSGKYAGQTIASVMKIDQPYVTNAFQTKSKELPMFNGLTKK